MDLTVYLAIGCVALIFVPIVLTYRFEKHMVCHFGELGVQPLTRDPYMRFCLADATQAGFSFLGWSRDLRGGLYQVSHALLVSPDRTTIAVVTTGFLMVPIRGVCLYTPTVDGRLFFTTNSQNFAEMDLSRNWTNHLALEASVPKLWQHHQAWLQKMAVSPRTFDREGHELEEFRAVREEHYRLMARAGLISYIDPSASRWRYTLRGAIRTAAWGFFAALMRKITLGRFPRNA